VLEEIGSRRRWSEELDKILEDMETSDSEIEASAIVSTDGFVISATLPKKGADEELIAAMGAAILNISSRALRELARGELIKVIVSGSKGDITIMDVGKEAVLLAITKLGASIGLLLVEMMNAKEKIQSLLDTV